MKSILLGLCAAVCLALAANPAAAGWFSSDPRILCPRIGWRSRASFLAVCMHDDELLSSNIATGGALTMASGAIEAAHQRLGGRVALRAAAA